MIDGIHPNLFFAGVPGKSYVHQTALLCLQKGSIVMKRLFTGLWVIIVIAMICTQPIFAQPDEPYREPYRPQYHYSAPQWWLNDPNGLVYFDGEYHLFFQHHPESLVWGPMHWGHAVSTDLIHWQTLPIALYPDEHGAIWSGSVVVDADNSSGLVPGGGLVAVYSHDVQTQSVAYSNDRGRTWTKYSGNPVIGALAPDFRDPKVFWHDDTQRWVMVIAAGKEIQVFTSANLIEWEHASTFITNLSTVGVWEVPDLFPLDIGDVTKWVLLVSVNYGAPAGGSGTMYFIGDFDGTTFLADPTSHSLWLDYGPDNYAGTTWNNTPDGKRIFIGWMNNWLYANHLPTDPWRGAMTIPREFTLVQTPSGMQLAQQPVETLEQMRTPVGTWEAMTIADEIIFPDVINTFAKK